MPAAFAISVTMRVVTPPSSARAVGRETGFQIAIPVATCNAATMGSAKYAVRWSALYFP